MAHHVVKLSYQSADMCYVAFWYFSQHYLLSCMLHKPMDVISKFLNVWNTIRRLVKRFTSCDMGRTIPWTKEKRRKVPAVIFNISMPTKSSAISSTRKAYHHKCPYMFLDWKDNLKRSEIIFVYLLTVPFPVNHNWRIKLYHIHYFTWMWRATGSLLRWK